MKKILTVVGARPQFIKASTVSRVLSGLQDMQEVLVHTGQHFDRNMSDIFFSELGMPHPHYHLGINSRSHGAMTGQMLAKVEEVLLAERPDWVLVYGDTNSTLAGALAASKLHIPVAHVEAGLRSFNRRMPEEINRVLTDHVSQLLFAPTETALQNLMAEGIATADIRRVGDVMFDAAQFYAARAEDRSDIIGVLGLASRNYLLATIHRQENTDDPARMAGLMDCLNAAAAQMTVILPLHPRARAAIEGLADALRLSANVRVIEPLGYLDMVMLEKHARAIATDSGGVQKEAYFHQVPCITLRDETEWVELVEQRWNVLVGADRERFQEALSNILDNPPPPWSQELYGNGHAAEAIVEHLSGA